MARRGWGEGSVCRRTVTRNGKDYTYWRVVVSLGSDPSGRRVRREHQARTERQARAWLRSAISNPVQPGVGVTVGEYAASWIKDTKLTVRPSTTAFYRSQLFHFESIAHLPLTQLTSAHVRELIATESAAGKSTRTVRGIVQTLALILRRAQSDGLVDRNVAALVRLPKLDTKPPLHFTAEQARRFLEVAKDDELGSLYAVAIGTGLRRGELLALTWREVDWNRRTIAVRRSKTGAGVREVPLAGIALAVLGEAVRRPGAIWPYRPEFVSGRFRDLCERAGVPYITFHGLRHTAASLMLDAGVDPLTIQGILGHTKVSMTGHYARAGEELRRDAVERLGRAIA